MGTLVVRYYDTDDLDEQRLLRHLMRKGIEIDGDRREDLAKRIMIELDRAFNRKKTANARHG